MFKTLFEDESLTDYIKSNTKDPWIDTPFENYVFLSPKQKGEFGERFVHSFFESVLLCDVKRAATSTAGHDRVVDGTQAPVQAAGRFRSLGGIGVGMMPTTDALLSAVSVKDLQAKIDEVTATKKPPAYSRETIVEYANTAFKKRLQRAPTSDEIKSVIGFVHNLQNTENLKFDLGAEIGAKAEALDPERAEGISYYNTAQTVKNALGLK